MASLTTVEASLGESIPKDTNHAISVSLPSLRSNIGYEEGEEWVVGKMQTGYPRFFIHKTIEGLARTIAQKYGRPHERAMLFPSHKGAARCVEFINVYGSTRDPGQCRILDFVPDVHDQDQGDVRMLHLSAAMFHEDDFKAAKTYWQHTGEGVSSRRAEHYVGMLRNGLLVLQNPDSVNQRSSKGPKRYRKGNSNGGLPIVLAGEEQNPLDRIQFIEERFGRNLNLNMARLSKQAIKRRIVGSLTTPSDEKEPVAGQSEHPPLRDVVGLTIDDVFLYPCGMNAIFHCHDTLRKARSMNLKSISYGFPYIDTLKVLEKFGPGAIFYGHGSSEDLDDLERRLKDGERYLGLFCEFPGNPLLQTPNLRRIRALADEYDFAVVVDETVGNYLNTHVLPFADVVVSSLTKIFSGDSNVSGGSAVLNPTSRYYSMLRDTMAETYQDCYWPEDAVFMERNSRDFVSRIKRINANGEAIAEVLHASPKVKEVYYPKYSPSRPFYDHCRTPNGGYGGLLSATFSSRDSMASFFDNLDVAKGPSLGTNFTLASPFVILAHYGELEWAASYGVDSNLVRFSVGLEDSDELAAKFRKALEA